MISSVLWLYDLALKTIRDLLPNDLRKKHGLTLPNYNNGVDSIKKNFSPGEELRPKSVERLIVPQIITFLARSPEHLALAAAK
jgi:hypothetical protein